MAVSSVHPMYPAFDWSVLGSWPSWISARVRSHAWTRVDRAMWVTSVRIRWEDQISISSHPLADLGEQIVLIRLGHSGPPHLFHAHLALDDQVAWAVALVFVRASKFPPRARTPQAMRASLLASAIARTLRCRRFLAASIQGLSPWRSQLFGLISGERTACTNRTRR